MADDREQRWGVYSFDDGRWFVSVPPTREAAEENRTRLSTEGEGCCLASESVGLAMQNAANHARDRVLREHAAIAGVAAGREVLRVAVGGVLFNAMNYPEPVQSRMLGQDTRPLTERVVGAVLAARGDAAPTVTPAQLERARAAADRAGTPTMDEQAWCTVLLASLGVEVGQ